MADDTLDPASRPPDFRAETIEKLGAFVDAGGFAKSAKWFYGAAAYALQTLFQLIFSLWGKIAAYLIRAIAAGMEGADPAFGEIAKAGISALFGIETSSTSFERLADRGSRDALKRDVGKSMMQAITGNAGDGAGGDLAPSLEPTLRYLGTIADFAIEGWLMSTLAELESLGYLEKFGELKDTIGQMFGFGRLTRRILGPLIDVSITTPAQWQVNQTYRPQLLSSADAIRQFLRGRWTVDQMRDELARQGYSDERIDALTNGQAKFFSAADVRTFVDREHWTRDQGIQHLRDQGYDDDGAQNALRLEGLHRIDQLEAQEATAIISAYATADIDRADFVDLLNAHVQTAPERALYTELAELRRHLNIKHLSSSQAAACVRADVLAYVDYRDALEREGYDPDAVTALEILLRAEIDKQHTILEHRAAVAADRAAEKAARDQAAADKRAQVAADRALAARGPIASLERAVVRGLIPITRYQESIAAKYDGDTVDVLTSLVEGERQDYLAQQQKADAAKQTAGRRNIDVAQLEAAVLAGVLTMDQYRAQLAFLKFSDADAGVLAATLQAKIDDRATAQRARADAIARAAQKHIKLDTFEQLVRRGHRTVDDYRALLASLGYDVADQAAIVELLELKIADDAKAADARAALDARQPPGQITIAEFRRAVLLQLKTIDDFDSFLTSRRVDPDVHALLVAELRDDVTQADAARLRRDATPTRSDARVLPLSVVRQAARLGVIPPATYQTRLEDAGYSVDDVAIEMDLLVVEMADVQNARQQGAAVEGAAATQGLSLSTLARAVKTGRADLQDYLSRAVVVTRNPATADLLTRVLADELALTKAAAARRAELASQSDAHKVSLAVLEGQVLAGTLPIAGYVDQLIQLGIAQEDADLLASLLADDVAAGGAA